MTNKKKGQNRWEDHYSKKAKQEKFPARSVYKLKEIQNKFKLIKKGDLILDLGCAPGSWLLYAAELTGKNGMVTGIDLKPVKINLPNNAKVYIADIIDINGKEPFLGTKNYNIVLSDMAPSTTGIKSVDAARSFNLCGAALNIALKTLTPGGAFVCKIFQGNEFKNFTDLVKKHFKTNKIFKPESCRKSSKEIYIIGIGKKQEDVCQDIANGLQ